MEHSSKSKYSIEKKPGFAAFNIVEAKSTLGIKRYPPIPQYFTIEKHVEAAFNDHT